MAVTRKIRQKGADGAVTEVDIGALAANVVTDDERQFVSKAEKENIGKIESGLPIAYALDLRNASNRMTVKEFYDEYYSKGVSIVDISEIGWKYLVSCYYNSKTNVYNFTTLALSVVMSTESAYSDFYTYNNLPAETSLIRAINGNGQNHVSLSVANPIRDTDAATKAYVDAAIAAGKPSSTPIYVNVPASGWQKNTAYGGMFVQTIKVSGIKTSDNVEIISAVRTDTETETAKVWKKMVHAQSLWDLTFRV